VVTADSDTSQTVLVEVSPLGENTDDIAAENHQLVQSTLLGQEENSQSGEYLTIFSWVCNVLSLKFCTNCF
jgi:hypothetical protein